MVILDEICCAVAKELLSENEVLELIKSTPADTCLVLTGRGATANLIDSADTVTEMQSAKHAFDSGCSAQNGVEL